MFSLRVCVAVGCAGLIASSILVGVSFLSIQAFLFQLNIDALKAMPYFYSFILSFVGFAGFTGLILKRPNTNSNSNSRLSEPKPKADMSSEKKESVVSSGSSPFVILGAGTKLQNNSGATITLPEDFVAYPNAVKVDVPEETKKEIDDDGLGEVFQPC